MSTACGKTLSARGGTDASSPEGAVDAARLDGDAGGDAPMGPTDSSTVDGTPAPDSSLVCTIGGVAYEAGAQNLANECESCQPRVSAAGWTLVPDGTLCQGSAGCVSGVCRVCPSTCATDGDCVSLCPAATGAVWCCDTVTSSCFDSVNPQCPDQVPPSCERCNSDTDCVKLCGPAPSGTVLCCDTQLHTCAPFAQPACPGTLTCGGCFSNADCALCSTDAGLTNCCYATHVCYASPNAPCQ